MAAGRAARFGSEPEQIRRRGRRRDDAEVLARRPGATDRSVYRAHAPPVVAGHQIRHERVVRPADVLDQQHPERPLEIRLVVYVDVVSRDLWIGRIRPVEREWKRHGRAARRRQRHGCRRHGCRVRDLHVQRLRRQSADVVYGHRSDAVVHIRNRIAPPGTELGADHPRAQGECEGIGEIGLVIRFEHVVLRSRHLAPCNREVLQCVEPRSVAGTAEGRRCRRRSEAGNGDAPYRRPS